MPYGRCGWVLGWGDGGLWSSRALEWAEHIKWVEFTTGFFYQSKRMQYSLNILHSCYNNFRLTF